MIATAPYTEKMTFDPVPSGPFIEWLESQTRKDWTNWLSETQVRYIERLLQKRSARVNANTVDEILVALGQPHLLSIMYPD